MFIFIALFLLVASLDSVVLIIRSATSRPRRTSTTQLSRTTPISTPAFDPVPFNTTALRDPAAYEPGLTAIGPGLRPLGC